jgi:hypothetical protein
LNIWGQLGVGVLVDHYWYLEALLEHLLDNNCYQEEEHLELPVDSDYFQKVLLEHPMDSGCY